MKGLRSLISETFFGSAIDVAGVGVICFFPFNKLVDASGAKKE